MLRTAKRKEVEVAVDLPAELTQARRFSKTRSAQSGALLEDYVELIADLLTTSGEARPTDVARRLGVSHVIDVTTVDD
jgi:DtxR family manganese transport transcriptional regulator